MSPAPTIPAGIEALCHELDEVEWFGRSTLKAAPARVGPLDRLLFLMGATLAGTMAEEHHPRRGIGHPREVERRGERVHVMGC